MRLIVTLATTALLLAGCITPQPRGPAPTYPGSPGQPVTGKPAYPYAGPTNLAGCEDLVVITAPDTATGIAQEDAYIDRTFPGSRKIGQTLTDCGAAKVDVITIQTPAGDTREVWFDVSSFFGKVGGRDLDDLLDG